MLLVEYEVSTGKLLSAAMGGTNFIDLPETSSSCIVDDEETSKVIWYSHVNGGTVIITVNEDGNFLSADIELVTPPVPEVPKTPDQLKVEQLESELAALFLMLVESEVI